MSQVDSENNAGMQIIHSCLRLSLMTDRHLTAHQYQGLFVALQVIGGQIGLPLFVATMLLARSVKRHFILMNFCFSWIFYSIAYCLTYET